MNTKNKKTTLEQLAVTIDEHFNTTELDCAQDIGREGKSNVYTCSAKRKDSMAVAMRESDEIREAIMFGTAIFFDYQERNKHK